jgi:hypothetical protein
VPCTTQTGKYHHDHALVLQDVAGAELHRSQQQISTADHHPTICSSKAGSQIADAVSRKAVPWAPKDTRSREGFTSQAHATQQHADKQQQHHQKQHMVEPATAAASCPAACTFSSSSNTSATSSLHCMLARLSSSEQQLPALLGFPAAPWMPLNPHESGPPRPACEDER